MKWRVELEYEDGSFTEPRRIFFQAVYDGEPYYGYETKREALEAFCYGQIAIDKLRKEREAEQKKEEEKIKEAKKIAKLYECFPRLKICGEQKPEERIDVVRDFSPKQEAEQKEAEQKCDKDITFCHDCARAKTCKQKVDKEKAFEESGVFLGKFGNTAFVLENKLEEALFKRFEERLTPRLEKIENRLTEIEGVLSSIGSPEYDLRKKVAELEEWRIRHLMIFHDKPLTEEQQKKADKLFLEQMNK